MLRILRLPLALAALLAALLLLPAQSTKASDAEFVLKFATVAPDGTPWAEQLKATKKRIEAESNGRIKMKLFLGGSLGGEVETVRDLRRGRLQGWGGSTAAVAEGASIPQLQVMELPFLFQSFEEADYILDNVISGDLEAQLQAKGFVLGFWHENGWRNFATKGKPIHTMDDLKGMKMRSQESPVHLGMYRALGVQAESIPVPEVLGALQTGMVDGFDNTPLFSAATGWYEGVQFYTTSQHIYQPGIIIYSKSFLDSLPEDLQKVVLGDPQAEAESGRAAVRAMREDLLQNFRDAGLTVYEMTDAERVPFRDATRKVHEEMADTVGRDLLNKVYAGQKAYRSGN
jgi:tripartite ATP-independent transporter DctP family solute receptor